eukprot:m.80277 g.80277  ORF g.80277 m.80277 type:complete len:444 (-) comp14839_c0_seq1:30-1361(-)
MLRGCRRLLLAVHLHRQFRKASSESSHAARMDLSHYEGVKKVLQDPHVQRLGQIFRERNKEIRLVGGVVRDLLMGLDFHDVDLATDATVEEIQAALVEAEIRTVPTGLKHGTVLAVIDHVPFEITTLRTDENDSAPDRTFLLDAKCRDFTVNAMSIDFDHCLHDYFGGWADLAHRRVRFVADAHARIREDPQRILRYFRFHGRIASPGEHEPETLAAITDLAPRMAGVAGERIWTEFAKILAAPTAASLVATMVACGVLQHIQLAHVTARHLHELERVRGRSSHAVTLLVTLIDDHDQLKQLDAVWRLANAEKQHAVFLMKHREEKFANVDEQRRVAEDFLADRVPPETVLEYAAYQGWAPELVQSLAEWPIPVFPVTGRDLHALGKPGRVFGAVLQDLKADWMASRFTISKEELMERAAVLWAVKQDEIDKATAARQAARKS